MSRTLQIRTPNATERRHLRQMVEQESGARVRRWAATLLFFAAGLNAQQIAEVLAVHVNTIYAYLHGFAYVGLEFVQGFQGLGAPRRITVTQVDEIARIAEQSPTEVGLPYGRWSLAKLQDYLIHQRRLLNAISREHLRRLLKKSIFTCARSNASSSATTRNDVRSWLEFERFGDSCRATG